MKNKKLIPILFAFVFSITSMSCSREEIKPETEPVSAESAEYVVKYYLDGALVSSIDNSDLSLSVIVVTGSVSDPTAKIHNVMAFTLEEDMFVFCDENDIPLRSLAAAGDHLASYAETTGAIAEYEATGKVPKAYIEYLTKYFPPSSNKTECTSIFYDDCEPPGPSFVDLHPGMPATPPGWPNRASRYLNMNLFGLMRIYDLAFYRTPVLNWWSGGFAYMPICTLTPWADNRLGSSLHPF